MTSSLALGAVRCRVKCRQRHRRAGNRASKNAIRVPTVCSKREGHIEGDETASLQRTRRSPRAARTSRNCTRENRETSLASIAVWVDRTGKPQAQSGHARRRGVELGHSTCETANRVNGDTWPRRWWREGPGPRRIPCHPTLAPTLSGVTGAPGVAWYARKSPELSVAPAAVSTPAATGRRIQGKNRMQ